MSKQKDGRKGGKRQERPEPVAEPTYISGKLVIVVIVALALCGAGFSWWFRYSSTTQAAKFWGPQGVELIREPDSVHLIRVEPMNNEHQHNAANTFADHYHTPGGVWHVADRRDITKAHGLVHLRNELLMDRGFRKEQVWPAPVENWHSGLEFRSALGGPPLVIFFSDDCRRMLRYPPLPAEAGLAVPSPAFAEGLKLVFTEWRNEPAGNAAEQSAASENTR